MDRIKVLIGFLLIAILLIFAGTSHAHALSLSSNVNVSLNSEGDFSEIRQEAQNELREKRQEIKDKIREIKEESREKAKELKEERKSLAQSLRDMFPFLRLGVAVIMNAQVSAVSQDSLTVEKDGKAYTVNISSKTKLRRHFWGKADFGDFAAGQMVNIIGTWGDKEKTTINARLIRNLSIMARRGVFIGEVKSMEESSFVLSTQNRGDLDVTVDSGTKIENRMGDEISFAEVLVGHRARVKGLWNKTDAKIGDVTQIKDFSLPIVTPTPAP